MGIEYVDGAYNLASGTRDAFDALSDELVSEGLPPMVSLSGDREPEVQERLWYERMTLNPGSRKVYGYRFWNGQKWFQIHPDTVAPPGTGNHVARRSNDLKWPYNSDTTASRRAKVLAQKRNITREGENFRELWHWTFWGLLGHIGSSSGGGGNDNEEWDEMATEAQVKKAARDAVFEVLTGTGLGPGNRNHFDSLKFIAELAADGVADSVWKQPITALDERGNPRLDPQGKPIRFQAWGFLSSIAAQVQAGGPVEVDEDALAAALAPLITANLAAMSDTDVQRIAKAAADEQARRLAS